MRTVSDIASKVLSDDDVPRRAMSSVKLLLDLSGDILLDIVFFEGRGCDVNTLLLQILAHIDRFDDGFGASDTVVRRVLRSNTTIGGRYSVMLVGHGEEGRGLNVIVACASL